MTDRGRGAAGRVSPRRCRCGRRRSRRAASPPAAWAVPGRSGGSAGCGPSRTAPTPCASRRTGAWLRERIGPGPTTSGFHEGRHSRIVTDRASTSSSIQIRSRTCAGTRPSAQRLARATSSSGIATVVPLCLRNRTRLSSTDDATHPFGLLVREAQNDDARARMAGRRGCRPDPCRVALTSLPGADEPPASPATRRRCPDQGRCRQLRGWLVDQGEDLRVRSVCLAHLPTRRSSWHTLTPARTSTAATSRCSASWPGPR